LDGARSRVLPFSLLVGYPTIQEQPFLIWLSHEVPVASVISRVSKAC